MFLKKPAVIKRLQPEHGNPIRGACIFFFDRLCANKASTLKYVAYVCLRVRSALGHVHAHYCSLVYVCHTNCSLYVFFCLKIALSFCDASRSCHRYNASHCDCLSRFQSPPFTGFLFCSSVRNFAPGDTVQFRVKQPSYYC